MIDTDALEPAVIPSQLLPPIVLSVPIVYLFDGVFFDSDAGDSFADRFSFTPNAALVVNADSIEYNSASALDIDLLLKDEDGNPFNACFDYYEINAVYNFTSFGAAGGLGVHTGWITDAAIYFATGQVKAWPGLTNLFIGHIHNQGAVLGNDGGFAGPGVVRSRVTREGNLLRHYITYPGQAEAAPIEITLVLTATSYELPREFSQPLIRFKQGTIEATYAKVSASFPNAPLAFVGDSLTQGRFATTYGDAFPQKIRADYPGEVLVCGAPGALSADWLTNIGPLLAMKPTNAFIMLGTNDDTMSVPLGTFQSNYTAIVNAMIAVGINPIVLTIPPKGSSDVPIMNTWLMAQGWDYIDVYPALLGTGTALHASFDSGDGVHLNTAGNSEIYDLVAAYIIAEGLA